MAGGQTEKLGRFLDKLYKLLLGQYSDPAAERTLRSLNVLCVRRVFCLYADSTGVFAARSGERLFHRYLRDLPAGEIGRALAELFQVLGQREAEREPDSQRGNPMLSLFPYVGTGLFAEQDIEIPAFTEELKRLLAAEADHVDWAALPPTQFGAVYETTLSPRCRRSGGMHYTTPEVIHKVIDPLFLDDLKAELEQIRGIQSQRTRKKKWKAFQNKLAGIVCLDPANGSGNFLTETYLSLRRLENQLLRELSAQVQFAASDTIRVSTAQIYGIELNGFAVSVAKTALWIAEMQMTRETESIVLQGQPSLPRGESGNIVAGNALQLDWSAVVPQEKLSYLIGNPPYAGARTMSKDQKTDLTALFSGWKNAGNLDYVCGWFKKAADLMQGTSIRAALVSTNSITQGESVSNVWKPLFASGVHIDFAYRNFPWCSTGGKAAQVHCVIIGFSCGASCKPKMIYDGNHVQRVGNINGYLLDGENIAVESRGKPLCAVPEMGIGNKPIDGGQYLFTEEERDAFLRGEPTAEKWFRPWYGAREFLYSKPRYCLWLGECTPEELGRLPLCQARVEAVRAYRLASKSKETRALAASPTRFHVQNMPKEPYLVIPEVSSERRTYVPMAFLGPEVLCSNLLKIVPKATLYHFGVLTSSVHMAWMRAVCGRLEMSYDYSVKIVYNNFPWPDPAEGQWYRIGQTAQGILDARAMYPNCSLADLYDDARMPEELREAHQANDRAVMEAYQFQDSMQESDIVKALLERYRALAEGNVSHETISGEWPAM